MGGTLPSNNSKPRIQCVNTMHNPSLSWKWIAYVEDFTLLFDKFFTLLMSYSIIKGAGSEIICILFCQIIVDDFPSLEG